ncbi:hypothetical protein SprV_0301140400 [Sparganum proliferum]
MRSQFTTTIISAYVQQMTGFNEAKIRFYESLNALQASVPKTDKPVVLGDFNTRIETDSLPEGECLALTKSPSATEITSSCVPVLNTASC